MLSLCGAAPFPRVRSNAELGCACARDPKARHGPYYSLTHAVEGKTRSRFLPAEQADLSQRFLPIRGAKQAVAFFR